MKASTRARISVLIAGLHGVNAAEDDEGSNGDVVAEEWLSTWYPETHLRQQMMVEPKRKEMEIFKRMKVFPCCHKRIHEQRRRRKND